MTTITRLYEVDRRKSIIFDITIVSYKIEILKMKNAQTMAMSYKNM